MSFDSWCEKVFNAGLRNFYLVNTAYPPHKNNWLEYNSLPDYSAWDKEQGLGIYIHIPFCKTKCKFCEYVTMQAPQEEMIDRYLDAILHEAALYRERINFHNKVLFGFDIGGGTPTLLSESQLEKLLNGISPFINSLKHIPDYEQGIETNAEIACQNPHMLQLLTAHGFTRISMGIQTFNQNLLTDLNRGYQANIPYGTAIENFHKAGFKKVNLDLMYGLPGQDIRSWEETLKSIPILQPDQVSVYETRYKDSQLLNLHGQLDLNLLNRMYELAYDRLTAAGYSACCGSTAFTKDPGDEGLSSYLRNRTDRFIPYIGLGIGSQGMTREHLSYNYGKNDFDLAAYISFTEQGRPIEFFYKLPPEEILAKYIAISFYLGHIAYSELEQRMGIDFLLSYREPLNFLLKRGLIDLGDTRITLTKKGYRVYHGIIVLFYSKRVQEYIGSLSSIS